MEKQQQWHQQQLYTQQHQLHQPRHMQNGEVKMKEKEADDGDDSEGKEWEGVANGGDVVNQAEERCS